MSTMTSNNPIRVMLVDDSAVIRGIFKRVLTAQSDIEVVCSVSDGQMAINNLSRHDIEVVILDIEMPNMDGLTALPKLMQLKPDLQIIMASTLTRRNAEISIRALANGAKDYIPKPESSKELEDETFQHDLLTKIRALAEVKRKHKGERLPCATQATLPQQASSPTRPHSPVTTPLPARAKACAIQLRRKSMTPAEIITIGSSTGGPQALTALLKQFPKDIVHPIIITQHMPPTFTAILAEHISKDCQLECKEAKDGDLLEPKKVYVAPGGHHLSVVVEGGKKVIRLLNTPPENFCKPSVDPMLRSVAEIYGSRVLTIILTGMGSDGLNGSRIIAEKGGTIIAQDEETSVVWGMPGAVSMAGLCSAVLPLNEIPKKIREYVG